MDLPLSTSCDYIEHAFDEEREDIAYNAWLSLYPWMMSGLIDFKRYEDYKNELFVRRNKSTMTAEEIITDIMPYVEADKRR